MISSIEISRFRGIREGKLDGLAPLTVLVGPNGCGKSTVLDALLIGGSRETGKSIGRAVQRHHGVKYGAPWLLWRKGISGKCEIKIATDRGRQSIFELDTQKRKQDEVCVLCRLQGSCTATVRFSRENTFHIEQEMLQHPSLEDFPGARIIECHRENLEMPLDQMLTEILDQGLYDQVMAIIRGVIPDVKELRIATEGRDPIVYIVYEDHAVPAALSGDGIYALVSLCLELATFPNGTVLIEEPEVHQHPGAIHQTIRAILAAVRRDIQVVLTTHSLELIDYLLMESSEDDLEKLAVYRMQLEEGVLRSCRLSGSEVKFSRNQINDDLR